MSNMKRWLREHGISYAQLAKQLNQSQPSISQKVNLKTCWQFDDCRRLRDVYGLSSDFVQDLVPYEAKFAESVRDHDRDHEQIQQTWLHREPSPEQNLTRDRKHLVDGDNRRIASRSSG